MFSSDYNKARRTISNGLSDDTFDQEHENIERKNEEQSSHFHPQGASFPNHTNIKSSSDLGLISSNQVIGRNFGKVGDIVTPKAKLERLENEWSDSNDDLLCQLAQKCKNDWKRVARKLHELLNKKYNALFLKRRYKIVAEQKKRPPCKFTRQEDLLIIKYVKEFGKDWTKIACHLPNRTPVMIKNRYYSFIRKKGKVNASHKTPFLLEEGDCPEILSSKEGKKPVIINFDKIELNFKNSELSVQEGMNSLEDELHDRIVPLFSK